MFWTDRAFDRLVARSEQLGTFPESGRRVPEYARDDVREVVESPYRVIYRVGPSQLDVPAVVHERRALPIDVDDL